MRVVNSLIIGLLILSSIALGASRERTAGYCELGNKTVLVTPGLNTSTTTPLMRSYPGCTVTVYLAGTLTLAPIYSDNAGTPKSNPFTADASGFWFWYADDGRYDVKMSGTLTPTTTLGDFQPFDRKFLQNGSGAVERTIKNKLTDVLSVKDFGAIGDGTTDDTLAIQATIDAAAVVGAAVFIPYGSYGISSPLIARTNTNLRCDAYGLTTTGTGAGGPTVKIKSLPSWHKTTGDALLKNDPVTLSYFTTVDNCTLEGNATTGPDYGIYFLNGNTLILRHILVNYSRLDGIFLDTDTVGVHQLALLFDVTVFNSVQNTGLSSRHGAIHLEWTDVTLNAVQATTSSEATYTQSGRRIACYYGPSSDSGTIIGSDCSHSEVGVRIESSNVKASATRSEFNASDGWQITGGSNSFSATQSVFDGRAASGTYYGFNVTGSANVFTATTEISAVNFQPRYGMYFASSNNPPNVVMGNSLGGVVTGFTAELFTTDPTHLIWDNYRQVPNSGSSGGGWTGGTTGSINVTKSNLVILPTGVSGPYTITGLTGGVPGQYVRFIFNGNVDAPSILTTSTIFLNKPWTPTVAAYYQGTPPHASLTLHTPDGTNWYEVARTDISVGISSQSGIIYNPDETANNRYWDSSSNTGFQQLQMRGCDDTLSSCGTWVNVGRAGATMDYAFFPERIQVGPGSSNETSAALSVFGGNIRIVGKAFASLGTPNDGSFVWCNNCNVATPCTSGGSGAFAFRSGSSWKCPF